MDNIPYEKLKSILVFYQLLLKEKIKSYQIVVDKGKELKARLENMKK